MSSDVGTLPVSLLMMCTVVMETLSVFSLVTQHHNLSFRVFFISNSYDPDTLHRG